MKLNIALLAVLMSSSYVCCSELQIKNVKIVTPNADTLQKLFKAATGEEFPGIAFAFSETEITPGSAVPTLFGMTITTLKKCNDAAALRVLKHSETLLGVLFKDAPDALEELQARGFSPRTTADISKK